VTEITAALEGVAKHVGDEAPLLETCFGIQVNFGHGSIAMM
jgi:hypothetical protein